MNVRGDQVICHGIPDRRPLEDGDIINVDVSVFYKGYNGDLNETYVVGKPDEASKQLVKVTSEVPAGPFCMHGYLCAAHVKTYHRGSKILQES